jgi:ATP-dependent Clp protease ATP-binding subunit ClpX
VIDFVVSKAQEYKLGARGLRSIMEAIMLDYMFDMPDQKEKQKTLAIDLEYAKDRFEKIKFKTLKAA